MDATKRNDVADTVGANVGRLALMTDLVARVDGLEAAASDEDIDLWWGSVEIDRMASGLTLAAIEKLSEASDEDTPAGPWLRKADATGDEPTRLTAEGREAARRISADKDTDTTR